MYARDNILCVKFFCMDGQERETKMKDDKNEGIRKQSIDMYTFIYL